jgi:DNA modification methylase
MDGIADATVDAIVTSPPYLNAIDYLRGHRLSLVWLGYRLAELRAIRADSIGAERMLDGAAERQALRVLMPAFGPIDLLPARVHGMVERYLRDLLALLRELRRVLKPNATATLVVGNSRLHGVLIDNAAALTAVASKVGLPLLERTEREFPAARRYLPPPQASETGSEPHRMRTEVVLTFQG